MFKERRALKSAELDPQEALLVSGRERLDIAKAIHHMEHSRALTPADKIFEQAILHAWHKYEKTCARLQKKYDKATSPADEKYNVAMTHARREFSHNLNLAWTEYSQSGTLDLSGYEEAKARILAEYEKIMIPLQAEYAKTTAPARERQREAQVLAWTKFEEDTASDWMEYMFWMEYRKDFSPMKPSRTEDQVSVFNAS